MKRLNLWIPAALGLALAGLIALSGVASAHGPGGGFGHGPAGGGQRGQLLADALGISLEELQAARAEAFATGLEQAVEAGRLTQEQADLMLAGQVLRGLIDRQAITADILGLTVEELQAAHEEGKTLRDLLDEAGITAAEFAEQMQARVEAIIDQAVADGLITAEQAEQLKNRFGHAGPGMRGRPGGPGGRGGIGPGHRGPGRGGEGLGPDSEDANFVLPTLGSGSEF